MYYQQSVFRSEPCYPQVSDYHLLKACWRYIMHHTGRSCIPSLKMTSLFTISTIQDSILNYRSMNPITSFAFLQIYSVHLIFIMLSSSKNW